MDRENSVLSEIYEILLQLRYPEITKAESKDIGSTILIGENRISLLSWLLAQQSEPIGTALGKLTGVALEDELVKYYTQIGICNNKDTLLGRCSPNEGLSTLKLLLEFMKNVHCEPTVDPLTETSIEDILNAHILKDSNVIPLVNNVNSKMTYEEAIKYFKGIENEFQEIEDQQTQIPAIVEPLIVSEESTEPSNDTDQEGYFVAQKKKFMAAFPTILAQHTSNKTVKNSANCMDEGIKSMYSDFTSFKQILEAKDKISKLHISKDLHPTDSPLIEVIEDIVTCIEEVKNVRINDSGLE